MHKSHQVKKIKRKAYIGVHGVKRKQFCKEYRGLIARIYSNMHNEYKNKIQGKKQISCKKGCIYCCCQHISSPLAHGIVIVDYLYSHDYTLNNFLRAYPQWEESAGSICREIDSKFDSAIQSEKSVAILNHARNPLISSYFDMQIPCPFLTNSVCSIYEVRPLNCAGHYSTSPREWCSKSSIEVPDGIEDFIPDYEDYILLMKLPNASSELFLRQATVPIMVHDILVNGLSAHFE